MADITTVVDGNIKFKEGKKWKNRWCVLKKPSPVADHLQLVLYKDVSEACKPGVKAKSLFTLDSFFGLEAEICVDREQHVLAIICLKNIFLLAFELRESMIRFEIKIRQSLGEEHQFPVRLVNAPSSIKLHKDQLCLMIHDSRFCLTAQTPPKILMAWNIKDLKRFVAREDKFIFEGGARCGKGSGLFALQSEQADEIVDIINSASSGKISNCHRKFKNRSSQIELGSHLISPLPPQSSSSQTHQHFNHHSQYRLQNLVTKDPLYSTPPATLNCCIENQTGSAESEDWTWYKRHSVSVTDHRRISALRDKDAVDNRGQIAMGIYDTPPSHPYPVSPKSPNYNYDHPKIFTKKSPQMCSNNMKASSAEYSEIAVGGKNESESKQSRTRPEDDTLCETKEISLNSWCSQQDAENVMTSEPHCGLEPSNYDETLQRLKKQERDLQKEMILLDEMLKSCATENQSTTSVACHQNVNDNFLVSSHTSTAKRSSKKEKPEANFGLYDQLPMTLVSTDTGNSCIESSRIETTLAAPVMPYQDIEIISGNVSNKKPDVKPQNDVRVVNNKYITARLNTSLPEGSTLSPLFHAKLKNIPPNSKLNAPLPYVNLSGYDDEATNHVHLPGSADRCLPVIRGSSFHGLNKRGVKDDEQSTFWRGHNGSLTSLNLPVAMSSLNNLNHTGNSHKISQADHSLEAALRSRNSIAHFKLKQAIEGPSCANASENSQHETLVVKLDPCNFGSETSTSSSMKSLTLDESRSTQSKSDLVNLLTVDHSQENILCETSAKENYENLLAFKEDMCPPPLPPKGPALLKKLASSNKGTSTSTTASHSRKSQYMTKNHKSQHNQASSVPPAIYLSKDISDERSSNYLEMGSPKTSHRCTPEPSKENKMFVKVPNVRDDYMDMGVIGMPPGESKRSVGDEIYLDADESYKHDELYISEKEFPKKRDVQVSSFDTPARRESTYIEMGEASSQQSTILHNLETLRAYVNEKLEGEKAKQKNKTDKGAAEASCSSKPRSFRVRHNSDSFPSKKANVTSTTQGKQGKSPMKVYSKVKASETVPVNLITDQPAPFTNLMEFTKRMGDGRSAYVNTVVNADNILIAHDFVPLPEPAKEGFLAKLRRRSSKDKGTPVSDKSGGSVKNHNSVFERSLSEHASPKSERNEKNVKIKLGRHRSSSFPNRLSYHEANDNYDIPKEAYEATNSSSSFSCESTRSKPSWRKGQSESSSSISNDSDSASMSKIGQSSLNSITLLQAHQNTPYVEALNTSQSTSCLTSLSAPSSMTDDEKMQEMFHKKENIYHEPLSELIQGDLRTNTEDSFHLKKNRGTSPCLDDPVVSVFENGKQQVTHESRMTDYCNMNVLAKNEHAQRLFLHTYAEVDVSTPPPLPPKNKSYQALLSPVLESISPLPFAKEGKSASGTNTSSATWKFQNEMEDSLSDQYVELKEVTEEEEGSSLLNASFNSKAGRESIPSTSSSEAKEINLFPAEFTTISLPIVQKLKCTEDHRSSELETSSPKSSPVLITNSITVEKSSISLQSNENIDDCTSPAKSVLRPRSGGEYVVLKRIPTPDTSCPSINLPSQSPPSSRVFNNGPHSEHFLHCPSLHGRHHQVSSCTSISLCSHLSAQLTPQQSPSLSSTVGTARSHLSLAQDNDNDLQYSCTKVKSPVDDSLAIMSSPPLSPKTSSRLLPSPDTRKNFDVYPHSAFVEKDNIFFPIDMTYHHSSPSPHSAHKFGTCESHPIYVNQQFVDMHYSHSQNHGIDSRTVSTCSSYSISSPLRTNMRSPGCFLKESDSNSLGRNIRMRSRHSESDASYLKGYKYSKSFSLPLNHQLNHSIQASVHRSNSDPKRAGKNEMWSNVSQNGIHGKEFDKFAKSSIIARRRLKHAESMLKSNTIDNDHSPSTLNMSISEPALSVQVSPLRSSGYKNIDRLNTVVAVGSSHGVVSTSPIITPVSHLENIVESQNSSDLQLNSSPREYVISNSPPPLPVRQRMVSTPSTISPPLTPFMASSDCSDSPPPYYAPPPPASTVSEEVPIPTTSSSEDDQELNYIEVDMSAQPIEVKQPALPISLSRRSKRARQQKKLAKLRYAEIDHTATKALQHTGQEHAQTRRGGLLSKSGSSLSRMNSAPLSKSHKPLAIRDRKPSTGSVESF